MPTPTELKAVASVLADEANTELTADEVSAKVWEVVERGRRRAFKYVVLAQSRRKAVDGLKPFFPTWVLGPFYTAAEAASVARKERVRLTESGHVVHNNKGTASVMVAQVFDVDHEVNPEELEEVAL